MEAEGKIPRLLKIHGIATRKRVANGLEPLKLIGGGSIGAIANTKTPFGLFN